MPSMANITVKKNDGITDQVWTQQVPASGDRAAAVWRNESVGTSKGHHPEARLSARSNAPGTVRRLDFAFTWKQVATDANTGLVKVMNTIPISLTAPIPQDVPDADVNEAVSQCMNMLASTLVKDAIKSGFAPG